MSKRMTVHRCPNDFCPNATLAAQTNYWLISSKLANKRLKRENRKLARIVRRLERELARSVPDRR